MFIRNVKFKWTIKETHGKREEKVKIEINRLHEMTRAINPNECLPVPPKDINKRWACTTKGKKRNDGRGAEARKKIKN